MLNNPEKTSTAWSELPEPSNQSYFIWKVNIPRLIELSRCLLFIVVSPAKLFLLEPEIGTSSCLYKVAWLFRSLYRIIVHCCYLIFLLNTSLRSSRAALSLYYSSKHQKNKRVISVVLKLRQVITKTNCTQSSESKLKTLDIWRFLVSHVSHARQPLMVIDKTQLPQSLST